MCINAINSRDKGNEYKGDMILVCSLAQLFHKRQILMFEKYRSHMSFIYLYILYTCFSRYDLIFNRYSRGSEEIRKFKANLHRANISMENLRFIR